MSVRATTKLVLVLAVAWIGGAFAPARAGEHLRVVLSYDSAGVRLVRLESAPAAPRRLSREADGWWAETRSAAGVLLDARHIRDPRRLHVEWLDESLNELRGGEVLRDRVTFSLILPVPPRDAARLDLFDRDGMPIASVSLERPIAAPHAPGRTRAGSGE